MLKHRNLSNQHETGMAKGNINPRTVVAPLAAFTMACVLFAYTRSSIQAAKLNAKIHRDAEKQNTVVRGDGDEK
ncbi:hypothetical protein B0T25DRAFT_531427 [Lasiosphaeria hispida]|uniref:Uncharacterized protein n=1 Tax=Lasiosphaeria hispida TaxID=260671 RepID=A0AAJ0HPN2_9PEZI|nr:hypothetical protein B0T25DRAFT_531427 [Lasiosphaeria hispida]